MINEPIGFTQRKVIRIQIKNPIALSLAPRSVRWNWTVHDWSNEEANESNIGVWNILHPWHGGVITTKNARPTSHELWIMLSGLGD